MPKLYPLLLLVLLLLLATAFGRSLRTNRAFLLLNHAEATQNPQLLSRSQPLLQDPANGRGLALTYIRQGNEPAALDAWLAAGGTAAELFTRGQRLSSVKSDEAILWYRLAQRLQPENPELWLAIGRLCQPQPALDPICAEAVARNDGNLLINADLAHGRDGWLTKSHQRVVYEFNSCPTADCIRWTADAADRSAAVGQCLALQAGTSYRFTADLKIDAPNETLWRPLYFQGTIEGSNQDFWLQYERGTADWNTWEYTFTAPEFEDNLACFYPIRTNGQATITVRNPKLTAIATDQ